MTKANDRKPGQGDWGMLLAGEMLLFGLLGRVLYQELEKDWIDSLIEEKVFDDAPLQLIHPDAKQGLALLQKFTQEAEHGVSDEVFGELRLDYTRLFIGPGKVLAPPWESVYFDEDRLVFQEQTLQVRGWYRRFGLQVEKLYAEPDDHIGLELEFLSHLAQLGLAALEKQDEIEFKRLMKAQQQFLNQHPLKWISLWSQQVEEHAHIDFYRGIGFLTKGALLEMASILNLEIPAEV
jgi:TorA maturation chaperone TorD